MLVKNIGGGILFFVFRDEATLKQFSSRRDVTVLVLARPHLPECRACYIIRHSGTRVEIMQSARVGKRGAIVVPAKLRKRFGIEEGSIVIAEEKEDGILIRPAMVIPVERYTPQRKAEFLLSNAVDEADYRRARKEVRKLGLDPDSIQHLRPE
jgi:AbrB family looped-hinge helix DNA binding protein